MKITWPQGIIGFFVLAVVWLAIFIVWATRHQEDLVKPNYYDEELRYQSRIEATSRARQQNAVPQISFDNASRAVVLRFPPPAAINSATGTVTLYRPSNAALDRTIPLATGADGVQTIPAAALAAGNWRIKIEWTCAGKDFYAEDAVTVQ